MPTLADLTLRKAAAEDAIRANAAALAAITGADPVQLPDSPHTEATPETVALYETVAQLTAAVVALAP